MTKLVLLLSFSLVASFVQAQQTTNHQGVIESPSAFVSGIGFISGWKCNSKDITLKMHCFYNHDLDPAQNMLRSDTREVCDGEIDNGWIIQVNWDDWGGCSQVDAFDNGQRFASRQFTVGAIGAGFIRDQEGRQIKVPGFPSPDQVTHFAWSTATQHFEGMYTADCSPGDACPGSGEGDDGNNNGNEGGDSAWNPWAIPEITINERVTVGTQPLPQYQGSLDFPQPNPPLPLSFSVIFEPGDWMFLRNGPNDNPTLLVPHDELEARINQVSRVAFRGVLPIDFGHTYWIVNLIGVGIERLYLIDTEVVSAVTRSNDPELFPHIPADMPLPVSQWTYDRELDPGGSLLYHFLNGETGEFGYRAYPDGSRDLTDQEIQDLYYPGNNRGPWRWIGREHLSPGTAIRTGGQSIDYYPPTETYFISGGSAGFLRGGPSRSGPGGRFVREDIRDTGKLEMIKVPDDLWVAWTNPPELIVGPYDIPDGN